MQSVAGNLLGDCTEGPMDGVRTAVAVARAPTMARERGDWRGDDVIWGMLGALGMPGCECMVGDRCRVG